MGLIGLIFFVAIVSAVFYPEPWGNDVDAGGNDLNNVGNITANYFIGDGSNLSGVSAGNLSFNQSLTDALYEPISSTGVTTFSFSNSKFSIRVT